MPGGLTGSTGRFERGRIHDRADWAAMRSPDASVNFRILLGSAHHGRGYGTAITRLVVEHACGVGGHRVGLGVYDVNPRARRVYEKCGFVLEGRLRDALRWDGEWHDELLMSVLRTDPRPKI